MILLFPIFSFVSLTESWNEEIASIGELSHVSSQDYDERMGA